MPLLAHDIDKTIDETSYNGQNHPASSTESESGSMRGSFGGFSTKLSDFDLLMHLSSGLEVFPISPSDVIQKLRYANPAQEKMYDLIASRPCSDDFNGFAETANFGIFEPRGTCAGSLRSYFAAGLLVTHGVKTLQQRNLVNGLAAYTALLKKINRFQLLKNDWDSYGSEPSSETAVAVASALVSEIFVELAPRVSAQAVPFFAAPLSGGGVQLEWGNGTARIEVEIGPDGKFGYLLSRGVEPARVFSEKDDEARENIVELIASVVS
jgi:hypothetical protein